LGKVAREFGAATSEERKHTMKIKKQFVLLGRMLAGLTVLLAPLPAFSQNCALCYTQTASAGARMIEALRSGILILVIPPTLMSIGMIFIVHHKRNQCKRTECTTEPGQDW
jgi:hypothetical protein